MKGGQIAVAAGTRPELIKTAPLLREFRNTGTPFTFVYTGQHYDYHMSAEFIEELDLPKPDFHSVTREAKPDRQMASLITLTGNWLHKIRAPLLLVEGDTNSVLAAAVAANKLGIQVGHVEAGLRSFDLRMPEEHNRRLTDHLSTLLFAPTKVSEMNLQRESVWGSIFVTGNTVMDACRLYFAVAQKRSNIQNLIRFDKFALATLHRAETVDDHKILTQVISALLKCEFPIFLPLHPRTKARLAELGLLGRVSQAKHIQVFRPVGYFDMLALMSRCEFIISDSGGIQEEATFPRIRRRVLVLREFTERPEANQAGFTEIVGCKTEDILKAIRKEINHPKQVPKRSPYGDGHAARKIANTIRRRLAGQPREA